VDGVCVSGGKVDAALDLMDTNGYTYFSLPLLSLPALSRSLALLERERSKVPISIIY
jgi:hypothetical protein